MYPVVVEEEFLRNRGKGSFTGVPGGGFEEGLSGVQMAVGGKSPGGF